MLIVSTDVNISRQYSQLGHHVRMVSSEQALNMIALLQASGVPAWVDGGWGVDALVGHQTRAHDDLDLVIPVGVLPACRKLLEADGFVVERDWLPTAIAFRHADGRGIDLHPIDPTPDGGGDQLQLDGVTRWHYAAPVAGTIDGVTIGCCSVECQVTSHLGYEPDGKDRADMGHLARIFDLQLPPPYASE
ncbi:MAG: nucleotidyltransferase domain-containing protein [Acidimicrobiales bacterium]